jgi:hypothetical protein
MSICVSRPASLKLYPTLICKHRIIFDDRLSSNPSSWYISIPFFFSLAHRRHTLLTIPNFGIEIKTSTDLYTMIYRYPCVILQTSCAYHFFHLPPCINRTWLLNLIIAFSPAQLNVKFWPSWRSWPSSQRQYCCHLCASNLHYVVNSQQNGRRQYQRTFGNKGPCHTSILCAGSPPSQLLIYRSYK